MKKSLILVGMLAIGLANAQQGNVGINTDQPQGTLDIQPNADSAKETSTNNQGILAPRLTKVRIANITSPVEGTLVYVSELTYTGTDTKVSDINEKGYYFYNGTKWVKTSAGNTVASNIYTADGSTNGDRTVSTAGGFLTIKGKAWNPLVVNSEIVPANADNTARGGLAVHPNDITKRVEFATTKDGDSRIWADGDRLFIKRATGAVGIGTNTPKAKLQVMGGIRANQGLPNGDDANLGYAFGNDGDTGLFSEADETNTNIAKSLSLYTNNVNRIFIKNDNGLVGINNTNPKVRLDVTGGGRFKRVGSSSTIEIDTDNNQWGHLDFRRNDVKRWDIGMTNGEETGAEAGSNFFISSFKDDGSFNGSGLFINRQTGNTGLGTDKPQSRLDVTGEIIARGQAQTDAYFGGDNVPAVPGRPMYDVEIGSIKAGVTDISLYNRADATAMNLYANSVNTFGTLQSNSLAGDGDKIVIANNDGTLTKGVSISNFATSNIYTANGTLTSNRVVDQAGKWLDFNNGGIRITGNDGVYFPLSINTKHSGGNGGIVINPNGDGAKRVELNSTPEGDFRLWLDGDKIYVNRSTGNVGLSVGTNPAARLDVSGELIARGQTGEIEAYFGGDGVGGDVEVGSIKAGVTDVTLYNRGDSKAMRLVSGDVNARGEIKATSLAGDGDKIVIANNDGTLTKGVSISNFATSNIYTADGSTNGDRTVSTANGFLTIKGNAWNPLVVNSEIVPSDPSNNARGGLAVHPNDMEKRVEFATTKDGDSRIWLDGDKVFIKRATGNVGIGTVDPQAKLDVSGSIKSTALVGTGNRNVMADKDGKLVIGEATSNIRTEVGDTMLTESDNNGYVYLTGAGTVTIPSSLPAGFSCIVVQQGDDQVVIAGDGVELQTARGTKTRAKFSAVGIIKRTTDSATITGDAVN